MTAMNTKFSLLVICVVLGLAGCRSPENSNETAADDAGYPAAEGFNAAASDDRAIAIADSVMKAMGGYENWTNTEIIQWTFFNRRTHTWDKKTGRDRIEIPDKNMTITFDINSREGTVVRNGQRVTQPDTVKKYLQQAYEMWVNDSYWLVMPYKLKDSGVTLSYMGMDSTRAGIPAYKLKLTFDSVGVTPQNMYHVYVDTTDYLVRQWAYFPEAGMDEPGFVLPWRNYRRYGNILLSNDRGNNAISDIEVLKEWPGTRKELEGASS